MREKDYLRLPPGYRLDLVGDPCVIVLRREDGAVVVRFTGNVDPQEIGRVAEEDRATGCAGLRYLIGRARFRRCSSDGREEDAMRLRDLRLL